MRGFQIMKWISQNMAKQAEMLQWLNFMEVYNDKTATHPAWGPLLCNAAYACNCMFFTDFADYWLHFIFCFFSATLHVTITVLYNADQFKGTQQPFQGWKELLSLCVINLQSMSLGTRSKLTGIVLRMYYDIQLEFWKVRPLSHLLFQFDLYLTSSFDTTVSIVW